MGRKHILLWIEAPLQSWGCQSKFGPRDTCSFPTKSGIVGLLLCALGLKGPQEALLQRLGGFRQTVLSFKAGPSHLLQDFQMVGSGYKEKGWESLNIPRKADMDKAVGGGAKMTYRYYIQNGCFGVTQELDDELAESVANALLNPVYDLYFGRKNCVPTDLIFRGVFDSSEEAERKAVSIAEEKGLRLDFKVSETEETAEEMILNDVPVSFGTRKRYKDRRVFIKREDGLFSLADKDN